MSVTVTTPQATGDALTIAGKTTVMRSIMGMIRHRSGSIRVGDTDVIAMPTHRIARGHAALAPEGRRLFSELSVEENLVLGPRTCAAIAIASPRCWTPSTTSSRCCAATATGRRGR
jgi:ABC-type branched-subunit amino acid transport system ATPase component